MVSHDKLVGFACCCIPRMWFVGFFALIYFCYGMANVSYVLINLLLNQGNPVNHEQGCVGTECQTIVSCEGMKEGSYHVHMTVTIIGGVYSCGSGLLGLVNSHSENIWHLGRFFHALAVVSVCLAIADGLYVFSCSAYPKNIIDAAVLWPVTNYPTTERNKQLIHQLTFFPKIEIDKMLNFNLWFFYMLLVAFLNIWYFYLGIQIKHIADMLEHGFYGMGRNYDFGEWRDAVVMNESIAADFTLGSDDMYGSTDNADAVTGSKKQNKWQNYFVGSSW